ncbi:MAG: F0F1 ATP synthase subunit A, partial [Candidatus Levybacteria bacterium]|nr:F0F1 ATP synthase subunit A [Candidatus Levybacteria bacterium]
MAMLGPDIFFQLGPLPITNTLLNTLLIDTLIISGALAIKKNISKIPGLFQNIIEMIVEVFYNLTESIAGANTKKIFPYFFTFFIFILLANLSGLIPGAESIGFYHPG